jgi:hypothetical protein
MSWVEKMEGIDKYEYLGCKTYTFIRYADDKSTICSMAIVSDMCEQSIQLLIRMIDADIIRRLLSDANVPNIGVTAILDDDGWANITYDIVTFMKHENIDTSLTDDEQTVVSGTKLLNHIHGLIYRYCDIDDVTSSRIKNILSNSIVPHISGILYAKHMPGYKIFSGYVIPESHNRK